MAKNYYEILGIDKNANKKDINKAFKKLSLKWHPDKWVNGTDEEKKEAEEKFKEINEAHSILSDDEKRRNYDMYGDANGREFDTFVNMDDFFGSFRQSQKPNFVQGTDCRVNVSFTLSDSFNGAEKKVKYFRMDVCPECNGNGYGSDGSKESCIHCNGTGRIRNVTRNGYATFVQETFCPYCKGYGFIIKNPCKKCNGTGASPSQSEIDIKIPIGIFDGAEMVITGGGDTPITTSNQTGINGDLIITFTQTEDKNFTRKYDDIYSNINIDISDALCGSEVEVDSIDGGKLKFKIPKLTKDGHMFRFNGKGMKNIKNNNHRGNHMVKICYNYPQSLTEEQENLLIKFNEIEKNKN